MLQLTPLDSAFVFMEGANQYMHIGGLYIYDPSTVPLDKKRRQDVLGHKDILDSIEETLHVAPNMRRKLVRIPGDLDHPYWVEDEHFDIEFHVRHIALPKPGDWQQLCILVARLYSRPLDMTRPLWETYIIENLDNIPGLPPGCFATLNKVHHAAIDGVSGIQQMMAMHSLSPDGEAIEAKGDDDWKPERDPSIPELLMHSWVNSFTMPARAAEVASHAVSSLFRVGREWRGGGLGSMPVNAPRTIFNHMLSPHRVLDARVFDLKDIKAIKNAVEGATVNDVALTICGGAIRAYLLAKKELPQESMTAMIPINVRTEEEIRSGGNVVSSMIAAIGTNIADPLKRLEAVRENTKKSKALIETFGAREISSMANLTPAVANALAMKGAIDTRFAEYMPPPFNLVISNVPGAQVPLYMAGSQLMTTFGLGPCVHGQGLFIAPQSYNGIFSITFTACRAMVPDPQFFAECIGNAKNDLEKRVLNKITVQPSSELVKVAAKRKTASRRRAGQGTRKAANGAKTTGAKTTGAKTTGAKTTNGAKAVNAGSSSAGKKAVKIRRKTTKAQKVQETAVAAQESPNLQKGEGYIH